MKNNVSFESDLFKFGIGLFETIKITNEPINIDSHMNRIINSIKELNLGISYEKEFLKNEIYKYIKKNNIQNKALRLTLFDEGYNISTRDILYNEQVYSKGFKLNISDIKRGKSILYKHKTTNYFENIYTKKLANKNGFDDSIFLDDENNILECTMSNIFFIKEGSIFTPNEELPILNGTTKRRIIDICGEINIKIIQKTIKLEDISDFDFAFITNSLMGVMKVTQIENKIYDKYNEIFNKISLYL